MVVSFSFEQLQKLLRLTSLCIEAVKEDLLRGDDLLSVVYELPLNLLDVLVLRSPPLILQKLQMSLFSNFEKAWRDLFELRWPKRVNETQSGDWQQMYWEAHLQSCLDEAAEIALPPSFNGCLGEIEIADFRFLTTEFGSTTFFIICENTLKQIGLEDRMTVSACDYSKLSHHFQEFGQYARCPRLQNILCGPETSHLLRTSKLQSLVLSWIRSKEQIGGLCKLLRQNCESLSSLEFICCKFSSASVDEICDSLIINSVLTHGIQKFSISSSKFHETNPVSLPRGLVSFLSSGSSLCSLKFTYNHLGRNFANMVFNTLCDVSASVSILDLSENNITCWLSNFNRRPSNVHSTSPGPGKSLQSLRVLNIRGNNLDTDDAVSLRYALACLPNLEVLDTSDNPIEDDGIKSLLPYFVEASEKSSQFSELHVENCELSVTGPIELINTLSTCKRPLKSLSIADNVVGRPNKDLQRNIAGKLDLVEINMSKNRGGIAAAEFLSMLLSRAPELVSVNASYNLMPVESIIIICSALKALKGNLELLDLSGNNLDSRTTRGLAEILRIGRPVLVLSSFQTSNTPYDEDP